MDSLSSRAAGTEFPLAKRGYEPDVVDAFKDSVVRDAAVLEEELAVAKAKGAQLEVRLRQTGDADTVVQTAFLAAAEAKAKLLQEAEARGAQIIAKAEEQAAQIAASGGPATDGEVRAQPMDDALANAKQIEIEAITLLEDAKREAENIIAEAQRTALQAVGEGRDAVMERADTAREELHRLMWLLKTVKQAVLTGLVAAQEEAPELELVIDDAVDLADIRPGGTERSRG